MQSQLGTWTGRLAGAGLILTGVFIAGLGFIILHLSNIILLKRDSDYGDPPAFVFNCIDQRWWVFPAVLPALFCGIMLLKFKPRPRSLWIVVGVLTVLAPLAVILYCFIMLLAPLYQVQQL